MANKHDGSRANIRGSEGTTPFLRTLRVRLYILWLNYERSYC